MAWAERYVVWSCGGRAFNHSSLVWCSTTKFAFCRNKLVVEIKFIGCCNSKLVCFTTVDHSKAFLYSGVLVLSISRYISDPIR